jgi:hypothetical protein
LLGSLVGFAVQFDADLLGLPEAAPGTFPNIPFIDFINGVPAEANHYFPSSKGRTLLYEYLGFVWLESCGEGTAQSALFGAFLGGTCIFAADKIQKKWQAKKSATGL